MRPLDKPVRDRATFTVKYRTVVDQRIRNAMLTLGKEATNDGLKVGTAIGLGQHVIFSGNWGRFTATARPENFDPSKTFHLKVTVDVDSGRAMASVDGQTLKARLPRHLDAIRHVGFYTKQTASAFSRVEVERAP